MKKKFIFGLILLWLGWHLAQPINLTVADLGRHIKNGELILSGVWDVLYKNYYSYICPDYPFINHHWLFGVFSYIIWRFLDFGGLSFVYVSLQIAAFYLFVSRVKDSTSFGVRCAFCLLSIPLIATRSEIRPEGFSMLLGALFWLLGDWHNQGRLKSIHLKIYLFFLQILWVNLHSYFVLGPVMIFMFWLQARANQNKEQAQSFLVSYFIILGACLINPSGLAGALFPLYGTAGLGYVVMEGQSVFDMLKTYPSDPIYPYFIISFVVAMLGWSVVIKRQGFKKHIFMFLMFCLMSYAAFKAIRFISPYAYFWVPLSAYAWGRWMDSWLAQSRKTGIIILLISGILVGVLINFDFKKGPVFGLVKGNNDAAIFFKKEGLVGPIFSNYENGGYLIFHLSPQHRFFIDNRVEAVPAEFFKEIYIPMQVNNEAWRIMDKYIHFNVIFFSRNDQTFWGRKFIIKRLEDPLWAPVFVDDHAIVFLKRTTQNADVIARYEFKITKFKGDIVPPG